MYVLQMEFQSIFVAAGKPGLGFLSTVADGICFVCRFAHLYRGKTKEIRLLTYVVNYVNIYL